MFNYEDDDEEAEANVAYPALNPLREGGKIQ